jgi:hypothetical protein
MLVTTLPKLGTQAKVYDVPEADLSKYETVEATKTTYDEGKDLIAKGEEVAGGMQLDKMDVQAYGNDICICYFWWHGVLYYRYCYSCNSPCP